MGQKCAGEKEERNRCVEEKPLFQVLLGQGEKRWYLLGRPGQVNVSFVLGFLKIR